MSASSPRLRATRFAGLDGLRAIAVAMVLCYHLFPALLPGGFLGVDVFFTISGFLITSLLIREFQSRGRIRIWSFWRRRARRLLPALALTLLVSISLALLVGGDLLVSAGTQFAAAALFVSNWVFIAHGSDYFARDTPELFRNTWSLSIEEQFYVLLPLLLAALFRMRSKPSRVLPLLLLGLSSAMLMSTLSDSGAEATRIYFGSDSHTFGLLLGAAMAMALAPRPGSVAQPAPRVPVQWVLALVAVAGLACLGWLAFTMPEASPRSFRGGLQAATLASLAVIWAITRNGSRIGRMLDARPMRWLGERSYGIYLWHWPLLLILGTALPAAGVVTVGILTLCATIALAALSYRFFEQPIRRRGLRGSLAALRRPGGLGAHPRAVAASLIAVFAITIPASAYAFATAPRQTSAELAIARGQDQLDRQRAEASGAGTDEEAGSDGGADSDVTAGSDGRVTAADRSPDASAAADGKQEEDEGRKPPRRVAPEGGDISAIGDSVMLASLPELDDRFPGIEIDAAVSRGFAAGVGIASDQAARGALRSVLVVGLGTNGPVQPADLDALRDLAGVRPLVLVNAYGERDWIPGVNQELADFAAAHRGVVVADWSGGVSGRPELLAGDGIHPEPSGGEVYADCVQSAFDELSQPSEAIGFGVPRR